MIPALVVQSRGMAVFDDGHGVAALFDEGGECERIESSRAARLLRGASDIETVTVADLQELRLVVGTRRRREEALHAALLLIDGESSKRVRSQAAHAWSTLAADDAIIEWVEGILMSVPAPPEANFRLAVEAVRREHSEPFREAERLQARIRAVCSAWMAACRMNGISTYGGSRARAAREGWFRCLVRGRSISLPEADPDTELLELWMKLDAEGETAPTHDDARVEEGRREHSWRASIVANEPSRGHHSQRRRSEIPSSVDGAATATDEEIYHRYADVVLRFLANKVSSNADADELLHDTFLRFFDERAQGLKAREPRSYLLGVAHNLLKEYYRSKAKRDRLEDIDDLSILSMGSGMSTLMTQAQEQKGLLDALRDLPLKYQTVLELYYWEGFSCEKIAEVMDEPTETVRTWLRQGRQKLAELVQRRLESGEISETQLDGLLKRTKEATSHRRVPSGS